MPPSRYFLLVAAEHSSSRCWLPARGCRRLPVVEQVATQRTKIRIHTEVKPPNAWSSTPACLPLLIPWSLRQPRSARNPATRRRCLGQGAAGIRTPAIIRREPVESGRYKTAEHKSAHSRKSEPRNVAAAPRKVRLARQHQLDWFGGGMGGETAT